MKSFLLTVAFIYVFRDSIKAFFQLHGEAQASATCLILATTAQIASQHIADWAIRAFFKYGGEPRLVFPTSAGPRQNVGQVPFGSPNYHSTPAPPHMQSLYGGSVMTPEMHFSGKHNGIYLYFSRLLRPIWHRTLLVPSSSANTPLISSVR